MTLTKLTNPLLLLSAFITPFIFWTLTPHFYNPPKQFFLILICLVLLLAYSWQIFRHRQLPLSTSPLALPLFIFFLATLANLILIREGRPEALVGRGTQFLILSLLTWFGLLLPDRTRWQSYLVTILIGTGALLALHSLLQLTFLSNLTFLPLFLQNRSFTPTGSYLTTLTLILLSSGLILRSLPTLTRHLRVFYLALLILTLISLVSIVSLMLPNSLLAPILIPYRETWAITLDALKSGRSLILGVGLSNFASLYTRVKPLSLNLGPLWNLLPQTGTSELLTLLTTGGLLLFLPFVSLIIQGLRQASRHPQAPLSLALVILTLALLFTPASLPLLLIFFLTLLAQDAHSTHELTLPPPTHLFTGFIFFAGLLTLANYSLRPLLSEYYLRQAQLAIQKNDGQAAYNAHLSAIRWDPRLALTRLSYAETNLNLASALSQQSSLSDQDRNNISTLVQQAIRENKYAIDLRPNSSLGWQSLGFTYRQLINVASGADRFAIDSYAQAVALDPANPSLRVEFGGLFYQLGNSANSPTDKTTYFDRAITEFQTAIQLKPDYANAYYNLSKVHEARQDYLNSYQAMQQVVAYLDPQSSDYSLAVTELDNLKAKLPADPAPSASPTPNELTQPSPLPSPLPGGLLDLNENP